MAPDIGDNRLRADRSFRTLIPNLRAGLPGDAPGHATDITVARGSRQSINLENEMHDPTSPSLPPLTEPHAAWRSLTREVFPWAAGSLAAALFAAVSATAGYGAGLSAGLRTALAEANRVETRDATATANAAAVDTRTAEQLRELTVSAARLAAAFENAIPTPDADR